MKIKMPSAVNAGFFILRECILSFFIFFSIEERTNDTLVSGKQTKLLDAHQQFDFIHQKIMLTNDRSKYVAQFEIISIFMDEQMCTYRTYTWKERTWLRREWNRFRNWRSDMECKLMEFSVWVFVKIWKFCVHLMETNRRCHWGMQFYRENYVLTF